MLLEEMKWPQLTAACHYLIDRNKKDYGGDIYEFGVYNGDSLVRLTDLLNKYGICYDYLYGIDSFCGLPAEELALPTDKVFKKFTEGSYKASLSVSEIYNKVNNPHLRLIKRWYKDLDIEDSLWGIFGPQPAKLIHFDCDLYISTKQALSFMLDNKLIVKGTLLAFDEYCISNNVLDGEIWAHAITREKYKMKDKQIWNKIYYDKDTGDEIQQCLFEVISID